MPKKLSFIIIAILIIIVAGFSYLLLANNPKEEPQPAVRSQSNTETSANNSSTQTPEQPGKYIDYSAEAVAKNSGKRVLFFHAPWCPQCRELDASIRSSSIPNDVTIFKVDYDSNQQLRQQYGVTIQTTVVLLDDNGNAAKKYVAYDEPRLPAVIENLF